MSTSVGLKLNSKLCNTNNDFNLVSWGVRAKEACEPRKAIGSFESVCEHICSTWVTSNTIYLKQNASLPQTAPSAAFPNLWMVLLLFFKTIPVKILELSLIPAFLWTLYKYQSRTTTDFLYTLFLKLLLPLHFHYHLAPGTSFISRLQRDPNQCPHDSWLQ